MSALRRGNPCGKPGVQLLQLCRSFAIWRNIGGHQLTLEEAGEICEKGITSSELEMYREDGSIYRKRLGVSPDKLQIVKI